MRLERFTHFHQSFDWGEFEKSRGEDVLRLNGRGARFAQVIIHKLPFGFAYAWAPRIMFDDAEFENEIMSFLRSRYKLLFCQFEYAVFADADDALRGRARNYDAAVFETEHCAPRLPEETIIIDLRQNPEEMLNQMKSKLRYNINLAGRKGVKIAIGDNPAREDIEKFARLLKKTAKRDRFLPVSGRHIFELFDRFGGLRGAPCPESEIKMYLARALFDGRIIAASVLLGFQNVITYLHGAADYRFRSLMAPHFLQYESMVFGARKGYEFYDMWGAASRGARKEKEFAGITRFKEGFSGKWIRYKNAKRIYARKFMSRIYELLRENRLPLVS